jgi:hypothetical protein
MSAVVSDTTSLIALAGQGRLGLLGTCFKQVLLPDAVYAEWLAGDPTVAQRVQDCAFLRVETVTDALLLAELGLLLDRGEAAALTLAKTRGLPLGFLDDKNSARLSQIFFCGPNSPLSLGGKIAGGRFLVNAARGRCLRRRWRLADRRIVTREDRVHGRGGSYA